MMRRVCVGPTTSLRLRVVTTPTRSLSGAKPPAYTLGAISDTEFQGINDMYNKWASVKGECDLEDLKRGAVQAYMSLGSILQAREKGAPRLARFGLDAFVKQFDIVRPPTAAANNNNAADAGTGNVPMGDSLANDESIHVGAAIPNEENNNSSASSSSSSTATTDTTKQKDSVEALFNSVPMSRGFRRGLLSMMFIASKGNFNAYEIAHPNDYITRSTLVMFDLYNNVAASAKKKKSSPTVGDESTNKKSNNDTSTNAATTNTQATDSKTSKQKADDVEEEEEHFSVDVGWIQPPAVIPVSAQAYTLFALDVVTPPRRYHRSYHWFYERIIGHDNENERVAIATMFASNSVIQIARFLDSLSRLFAGTPVQFASSSTLSSVLRLPTDMSKCPPVRRKFMGFYLSKEGEWVMCELASGRDVYHQELAQSSK